MAKTAQEKAAEEAAKKAAEDKAAADKAAEEKAAADKAADDDADGKKDKGPKTFTEAEVKAREKAAADKAVADAKKKADEEKDLSDLEKANKRIQELEETNRLRDAKDSVIDALTKAGARSPELVWKALKGELEFDDKGGIKNLDSLVTGYKTDYADQFGVEKPADGIDAGKGKEPGTKLTEDAIKKMTADEINENWEEVSKVLASGK